MQAVIKKWGNSLAIRIPKAFAKDINIAENMTVNLTLSDSKIVIEPVRKDRLLDLVEKITDENRHGETSTGRKVGREIW